MLEKLGDRVLVIVILRACDIVAVLLHDTDTVLVGVGVVLIVVDATTETEPLLVLVADPEAVRESEGDAVYVRSLVTEVLKLGLAEWVALALSDGVVVLVGATESLSVTLRRIVDEALNETVKERDDDTVLSRLLLRDADAEEDAFGVTVGDFVEDFTRDTVVLKDLDVISESVCEVLELSVCVSDSD